MENWKIISNVSRHYEISDKGEVVVVKNGKRKSLKYIEKNQHLYVSMLLDGYAKHKRVSVPQLVAKYFVEMKGKYIGYKDGNFLNVAAENIAVFDLNGAENLKRLLSL